jgi:hypothetical protein
MQQFLNTPRKENDVPVVNALSRFDIDSLKIQGNKEEALTLLPG